MWYLKLKLKFSQRILFCYSHRSHVTEQSFLLSTTSSVFFKDAALHVFALTVHHYFGFVGVLSKSFANLWCESECACTFLHATSQVACVGCQQLSLWTGISRLPEFAYLCFKTLRSLQTKRKIQVFNMHMI